MQNHIRDILDTAKCCSVGFSRNYVNAVNHGEDTEVQLMTLFELNGLIKTIERDCKRNEKLFDEVETATLVERINKICTECNCN